VRNFGESLEESKLKNEFQKIGNKINPNAKEKVEDEDDTKFKNPHEVPIGMLVPASRNVYKIIKRTAEFCKKGGPKSIQKLKTNQQGNPSFSFLNKSDLLYPYFKFLSQSSAQQQQKIFLKRMEEEKTRTEIDREKARFLQEIKQKEAEDTPPIPPKTMCLTIEKVATAIIEFGRAFEDKLKNEKETKEDPLFCFLQSGNVFQPYYEQRLKVKSQILELPLELWKIAQPLKSFNFLGGHCNKNVGNP
jgi:hypothetical protein